MFGVWERMDVIDDYVVGSVCTQTVTKVYVVQW